MTEKFKNKYRVDSSRLKNWDYGRNAPYFVTICTLNRENYFGKIVVVKMPLMASLRTPTKRLILSGIGKITNQYWHEIPDHFPFAEPDVFAIMPNHVHGIIIINKTDLRGCRDAVCRDAINGVCTTKTGGITGNKNPMLHENLSRVVRWFKGRVTFESRKIKPDFAWQSRFYDRIIHNDKSHYKIRQYIENNAANWRGDELYNI